MKSSTRIILVIIVLALIPAVVKLQALIDPQRPQFQPGKGVGSMITQVGKSPVVLPSQFVAGTIIGLREVVAGLLWVRANDFFHSGDYEAIVPLTRIVTWLDPHQIDVYRVGAWHLAYNFTDTAQHADRRYLIPAITFEKEGADNNPHVSDLEFDLGFVLYSLKAYQFDKALYWTKRGASEPDATLPMHRQIAHAYEKCGRIEDALKQWQQCIKEAQELLKKDPRDFRVRDHYQVSKRNYDLMLVRKSLREDLDKHPIDVGFEGGFKRLGPRRFKISGKINLPDATRIDVQLADDDYEEHDLSKFSWDVDPNETALYDLGIHGIYTENGQFSRVWDVTKDTKQYPFKKDKYTLILTFNPRMAPDFVQDGVGWSGEGITDKKYLDTKTNPGVRMVRKVIHLERKDVI